MMSSRDNFGEQRSLFPPSQPIVKAGYMEKSDPRDGAEGTEERVLALHNEKLGKEIDESASVVVGPAEGTEERDLELHTEKLARELDESASVVFSPAPRGRAGGTEERDLELHTEKLARKLDESASVVFSPAPRGRAGGTEERVLALHTEKLARELDESASVVFSPAEGTEERVLELHAEEAREGELVGVRFRHSRHGPMMSSLEQEANGHVFGGGRMLVGRRVSSQRLARVWMVPFSSHAERRRAVFFPFEDASSGFF